MASGIPLSSGGTAAAREKSVGGTASLKVQAVTLAAGDTWAPKTVAQDTTAANALAANPDRVYAALLPRDGDIYVAASVANLASDATRRKVKSGEEWSTQHYLGVVAMKAVTGTVSVEVEEVS